MLVFKNVTFNDTWIEADAHMENCLIGVHVRINRKEDIIEYDTDNPNSWVAQACWNLLRRVDNGEVKQNSTVSIHWY